MIYITVKASDKYRGDFGKSALYYNEKNRTVLKCYVILFAIAGVKNAAELLDGRIGDYAEQYGAFSFVTAHWVKTSVAAVCGLIFSFVLFYCFIVKISDTVSYISGEPEKANSERRTRKAVITGTLPMTICIFGLLILTIIINNVKITTIGGFTKAVIIFAFASGYILFSVVLAFLLSALIMLVFLSKSFQNEEIALLYAFSLKKSIKHSFEMLLLILKLLPCAILSLLLPLVFMPYSVKKIISTFSVAVCLNLYADEKYSTEAKMTIINFPKTLET